MEDVSTASFAALFLQLTVISVRFERDIAAWNFFETLKFWAGVLCPSMNNFNLSFSSKVENLRRCDAVTPTKPQWSRCAISSGSAKAGKIAEEIIRKIA